MFPRRFVNSQETKYITLLVAAQKEVLFIKIGHVMDVIEFSCNWIPNKITGRKKQRRQI